MKPGWCSSEFWGVLLGMLAPIVALALHSDSDPTTKAVVGGTTSVGAAFLAFGYALLRTWLKVNAGPPAGPVNPPTKGQP